MNRAAKVRRTIAAAAVFALVFATIAHADTIGGDSDLVTEGMQTSLSLTATPSQTITTQVAFRLVCSSGKVADTQEVVGLDKYKWADVGNNTPLLGGSATVTTNAVITRPSGWPVSNPRDCSGVEDAWSNPNATLSITAPSAIGRYVLSVDYKVVAGEISANIGTHTYTLDVVPRAPASLTATAAGSDQINLSWPHSADHSAIDGYKIYRKVGTASLFTSTALYTELPSGAASPQLKSDGSLDASTTYCYKVTAYKTIDTVTFESAGAEDCATTDAASSLDVTGFHRPVDDGMNVMKGGRVIPLKFNVFDGLTEITDTGVVDSFRAYRINCATSVGESGDINLEDETSTSGKTELRYGDDSFIQNWKTPKVNTDTCYRAVVTVDGNTAEALFKLTK